MVIIKIFCLSRMEINALTMFYEGGVGYMIKISDLGVIIFGLWVRYGNYYKELDIMDGYLDLNHGHERKWRILGPKWAF